MCGMSHAACDVNSTVELSLNPKIVRSERILFGIQFLLDFIQKMEMKWIILLSKTLSSAQVSPTCARSNSSSYTPNYSNSLSPKQSYELNIKIFINVSLMAIIGKMNLDQKRAVFFGLEWPIMLFVTALSAMNTECGHVIRVMEKAPLVAKFALNTPHFWKLKAMSSTIVNDLECTLIINIHVISSGTKMVTSGLVFKSCFGLDSHPQVKTIK